MDILERLRMRKDNAASLLDTILHRDAAAEIERLRAALEPFASYAECFNRDFEDDDPAYGRITVGDFRRARNVLTAE
jgi:hypothetical protein